MSFNLVDRIFDLDLPAAEKQVLQALARRANDDGTSARPSIVTVARWCGRGTTRVREIIRELETEGVIELTHQGSGRMAGKKGRPNEWALHLDRVAPLAYKDKQAATSTQHPSIELTAIAVRPQCNGIACALPVLKPEESYGFKCKYHSELEPRFSSGSTPVEPTNPTLLQINPTLLVDQPNAFRQSTQHPSVGDSVLDSVLLDSVLLDTCAATSAAPHNTPSKGNLMVSEVKHPTIEASEDAPVPNHPLRKPPTFAEFARRATALWTTIQPKSFRALTQAEQGQLTLRWARALREDATYKHHDGHLWPIGLDTAGNLRVVFTSQQIADEMWATVGPQLVRIAHDWNPAIQRIFYMAPRQVA